MGLGGQAGQTCAKVAYAYMGFTEVQASEGPRVSDARASQLVC